VVHPDTVPIAGRTEGDPVSTPDAVTVARTAGRSGRRASDTGACDGIGPRPPVVAAT